MARKTKPGLDYFPMDVDFFEDEKIELISSEFAHKGENIAMRLLCKIYRNGYYLPWNNDQSLLFAKRVGNGVTGALVDEVVQGLIRRSFFDKGVYDSFGILTSKGIQTRYIDAKERAKEVVFFKEHQLIDDNVLNKWNNVGIKSINDGINPQRKEEKRKEKEIKKEDNGADAPALIPGVKVMEKQTAMAARQKEFYASLVPFVDQYGKKLIRVFFDHWSEPNKSKTKMKYELESTWDVGRRLAKWEDNDRKWNKGKAADAPDSKTEAPKTFNEEINYLIGRCQEGKLDESLINVDHYDKLQAQGYIPVGTLDRQTGATIDEKKRAGVLEFIKTNSHAQVD